MPLGTAILDAEISTNGEILHPFPARISFLNSFATAGNKQQIAAGATDVSVNITGAGTINFALLWDDVGVTGNSLTVKVNGSSFPLKVHPFLILSEDITALTVTNSDPDNDKFLNWSLFTT